MSKLLGKCYTNRDKKIEEYKIMVKYRKEHAMEYGNP